MTTRLQEKLLKEMIAAIIKEIAGEKQQDNEDIGDIDISSVSTEEAKKIGDRLGIDWNRFDLEQLRKGIAVEYEHESDPAAAARIALDHLRELSDYYDRLEDMEAEGRKELNIDENVLDKMGKKKINKSIRKGFVSPEVYSEFPSEHENQIIKTVAKNLHKKPGLHSPPSMGISLKNHSKNKYKY